MIKMFSDAYFKVGTLDTAQLVADNNVPVFQYRFQQKKILNQIHLYINFQICLRWRMEVCRSSDHECNKVGGQVCHGHSYW